MYKKYFILVVNLLNYRFWAVKNYRFAFRPLFYSALCAANHVLRSQAICFEPKKSWKILADLPAEGRSPEVENSYHPIWLHTLNEIRTHFRETPDE